MLACILTATGSLAKSDEPSERGARKLLDEVAAAYKALPAYSDQGVFVLALSEGGKTKALRTALHVSLIRPNKINVDTGLVQLVSDGKTLTTVVSPLQKYSESDAPKAISFDGVFAAGPAGSALFGGPGGQLMVVVMNMLVGENPAKAVLDLGETLTLAPDRERDGKTSRVLKMTSSSGPSYFLSVDPESRLLREIDVEYDPKQLAEVLPPGSKASLETFRWSAGEINTRPPAETVFAFEPPKGFTKVDALTRADGPEDEAGQKFKVQEFVGKPAPAFTLTVLDGEGKTKTVALADLAGKVVLIDFWATWCGPCLAELPEIQKLVESYAKAKKDVVIIAVSQDDDPRDPAEVRKLIEKTLETKKIKLTGTPVGKVALDPSKSVGDAFQVEGYPTVVLIDPKGVVRAAHVGFSPEVGKVLAKEIDALLEGKTLEKEKSPEKK